MNLPQTRWKLLPPVPEKYLSCSPAIHPLLIQLLYNRGITDPALFESFITADQGLQGDPFHLPDMHKAVNRIYRALLAGENIAIYGDFDADGITATALLVETLSALGGKPIPYIPHRFEEGYGLKISALEKLRRQGINLIITVDCGTSAVMEVKQAKKIGIDIIITDHHITSTDLPQAVAVINPTRTDSNYPFPKLAGVGVAYKLFQALLQGNGRDRSTFEPLDLVAIGTVTDMAPLVGENRYLVKEGLKLLNATARLGLQEMIRSSRLQPGTLDTEKISWVLGPRLNAAGRLDHAITSYRLLTTRSPEEANLLARELERKNSERQKITEITLNKAKERILSWEKLPCLLMIGEDDFPPGVIGIVASKLTEEFYRPTIVLKLGQEVSQGSCRSIPEFNLIDTLENCRELLLRYGGHPMAAGFTVSNHNLMRLQQRLLELAEKQLASLDLRPPLLIDAEIPLEAFKGDIFNIIQKLAPFGCSNPVPTFLSRGVRIIDCHPFGTKSEHLALKIRAGDVTWNAVGFKFANLIPETASLLDIVYNLEIDRWGGEETLRLNLLDFAPHS